MSPFSAREIRPRENRPYKEQEQRHHKDLDSEDDYQGDSNKRIGRHNHKDRGRPDQFLVDLQNNSKFRHSVHENELRRNNDEGSRSSSSYEMDELQFKPKLPPVPRSPPRSPSPQRNGEKIAGIYRAGNRNSATFEITRIEGEIESPKEEEKPSTKHVLRPKREEIRNPREEKRKNRIDEEDVDEKKSRNEKLRQQREKENEEAKEEERRKRKEEKRREERRRQEEEEEEEEKRRLKRKQEKEKAREREEFRDDESEESKVYEGRFKKSASGRRSKGKGQKMGRSRSTGNALDEMDRNYQRSRSKSPSSVRSLNVVDCDDDDDDSSIMRESSCFSKALLFKNCYVDQI